MDLISSGQIKQRRYFDESGKAKQDIDYFQSGGALHNFPHIHYWNWSKSIPRSGAYPAQF